MTRSFGVAVRMYVGSVLGCWVGFGLLGRVWVVGSPRIVDARRPDCGVAVPYLYYLLDIAAMSDFVAQP